MNGRRGAHDPGTRAGERANRGREVVARTRRTVAVASLFVPNRPVIETLIEITPANASAIHALQAAVFRQLAGADGRDHLDDAVADCAESDVDGMKVAKGSSIN